MAHIDPVTGELVPCETTWVGPIQHAIQMRRLVQKLGSIEAVVAKLNEKSEHKFTEESIKRELWLINEATPGQRKELLIGYFLKLLPGTEEEKGKMKAILLELLTL